MTISVVNIKKKENKSFSITYGDIIFEVNFEGNEQINLIKSIDGDVFFTCKNYFDKKEYISTVKSFFDNIQMTLYHEILNNRKYSHPKYHLYKEKLNESINICLPMFFLSNYIMEYNFLSIVSNKEKAYMIIENNITNEYFMFEYSYNTTDYKAKYTSFSLHDLLENISKYEDKEDTLIQHLLLIFI